MLFAGFWDRAPDSYRDECAFAEVALALRWYQSYCRLGVQVVEEQLPVLQLLAQHRYRCRMDRHWHGDQVGHWYCCRSCSFCSVCVGGDLLFLCLG